LFADSGVHSCFGAPLARLEGQIALRLFFERVVYPRIVVDIIKRISTKSIVTDEHATAIDGGGRTPMPGMIEAHT